MIGNIQMKAGPITHKVATAAAAASGATFTYIPVAAGKIIHSNDIDRNEMLQDISQAPMLTGLSTDQAQAFAQWTLDYMNKKSSPVAVPLPQDVSKMEAVPGNAAPQDL